MEIHMKEISSMVRHMEKVFIIGLMVRSMMVNGKKVLRMDTVCGEVYSEIAIWGNG